MNFSRILIFLGHNGPGPTASAALHAGETVSQVVNLATGENYAIGSAPPGGGTGFFIGPAADSNEVWQFDTRDLSAQTLIAVLVM